MQIKKQEVVLAIIVVFIVLVLATLVELIILASEVL